MRLSFAEKLEQFREYRFDSKTFTGQEECSFEEAEQFFGRWVTFFPSPSHDVVENMEIGVGKIPPFDDIINLKSSHAYLTL